MESAQIRMTKDGSHTLWVPELQESYHSFHGAVTESAHVFINNGIDHYLQVHDVTEISVLEVGFGTGLNALLTCAYSQKNRHRIKYTTLEPFPLEWAFLSQLNYPDHVNHEQSQFWFKELHQTQWGQIEWLNPYFSFLKSLDPVQEHAPSGRYHICFFDAFAPSKQHEIWDQKVLEVIRRGLTKSGMLVSYCAQGQFKRNLRQLGFEVETLPGPPGKKEMTRAVIQS
jgi:tRNA U34 5-methylaminomethyl-2-thiouridine-forming methyltransferase MnmC